MPIAVRATTKRGVALALGGEAEERVDEPELRDRRAHGHERHDRADVARPRPC